MIPIHSLSQELLKIAAPAVLETLGRTLGGPGARAALQRGLGGLGAGAGLGGLGGAVAGGVSGYRDARQQGGGVGESLVHGLGKAPGGAAAGALVGGAGLGALQAAGAAPGAAGALTKAPGVLGGAARFGQRQVHALTGWTPRGFLDPRGARDIGAGAAGAIANKASAAKHLATAEKAVGPAERSEALGMTSLPGIANSIRKNGLGKTMSAGASHQWNSGGIADKAMMAAVPTMAVAGELGRKGAETEGRTGRLAGAAGQLGLMAAGGALPIAGTLAAGAAGHAGMKALGRLRQHSEPAHQPAPPETSPSSNGLASPVERQYSDRASGEVPVMSGAHG